MQDIASSSPVVGAAAAVSAPAASSSSANVANSSSTNGAAGSPTELARKRSRSTSLTDQTAASVPADKADNTAEGPSAASASASSSSAQADTTATDNATPSDSNKDGKVSKKAHLDHQAPSYVSSKHLQPSQNGSDAAPDQPAATAQDGSAPPSAPITIRTLIVTQDASVIIGKGGKNVNEIREKSGSKVTITEAIQGNPERIMSVSGPLDAVAKVSLSTSLLSASSETTLGIRIDCSSHQRRAFRRSFCSRFSRCHHQVRAHLRSYVLG